MASSDNGSLFSKVVSFVSGPGSRKPASGDVAQEDPDKASIQAIMDRKLHNDDVRKREFELLRQMRKREPQANRVDLNERTSLFPSSTLMRPGGRAQTIKKIDEIEQQMSQQWWKGKQIKAVFQAAKPAAPAPEAPLMAPGPSAPAPAPEPEKVVAAPPEAPAKIDVATMQGRLEESLFDEPSTGLSDFLPTQVNQFAHSAALEDAAILFANGDFERAAQSLQALLAANEAPSEAEEIWMTLFDLYRVTGDRTRFDGTAMNFAAQYGRSAPQWVTTLEVEPEQLAPEIAVMLAGTGTDWSAPAVLGQAEFDHMKVTLEKGAAPWHLDWSQLASVAEPVVAQMASLFSLWCASKVQLQFRGAPHLEELLQRATPTGSTDVPADWWMWRLAFLRLDQQEDEFERVALDYCITYEMSPPAWEKAQCDYRRVQAYGAHGGSDDEVPLLMGEELLSTVSGAFSAATPGFHKPASAPPKVVDGGRFGLLRLSGQILGDASQAVAELESGRVGFNKVVIDCQDLVRVDFPAAGGLLNWASERSDEGCKVEFKNVNRLVATFFSVIGIDEFARIIAPTH